MTNNLFDQSREETPSKIKGHQIGTSILLSHCAEFCSGTISKSLINTNLQVLPRQTCGLFTHTILIERYPGGREKLDESIQGGELFQTIVYNPVSTALHLQLLWLGLSFNISYKEVTILFILPIVNFLLIFDVLEQRE